VCEVHGRTSGSVLGNAAEDAIVLLARLGVKDIKILVMGQFQLTHYPDSAPTAWFRCRFC
jgi:hypothetical protein